jgi:hypothetical protein
MTNQTAAFLMQTFQHDMAKKSQHPCLRKTPYVRLPHIPFFLDRTNKRVLGHATIYLEIQYLPNCMPDRTGSKSPFICTDNY